MTLAGFEAVSARGSSIVNVSSGFRCCASNQHLVVKATDKHKASINNPNSHHTLPTPASRGRLVLCLQRRVARAAVPLQRDVCSRTNPIKFTDRQCMQLIPVPRSAETGPCRKPTFTAEPRNLADLAYHWHTYLQPCHCFDGALQSQASHRRILVHSKIVSCSVVQSLFF